MDLREDFSAAIKAANDHNLPLAMDLYNRILFQTPNFTPAWNQRGLALLEMGHPFDAIMNFDRAIELDPDSASAYVNRGSSYLHAEYFDRAIADFQRGEERDPKLPQPASNIGNACYQMNNIEGAAQAYRRAIQKKKDHADGHLGLAVSLLKLGQLEEGWKEFEWRWQTGQMPPRGLPYPQWDGFKAVLRTDTLLVYGEQGMGDALQFCRLIEYVKPLWGGKILLEVVPPLTRLMNSLQSIDGIVTLGERLPRNIVACVPMMSLPGIIGIKQVEDIPQQVPYLQADPYRADLWREQLNKLPPGLRVGLCWAGMRRDALAAVDKRRSMELSQFDKLAAIKGIAWVSLQLGPPLDQIKSPPVGMHIGEWGHYLYDFYDTAALIACLDMVITVDTAVAHVAGALGKPTWLLSRYDSCWRWLMGRTDTPWYPSMTLFTQEKPYDWSRPLDTMEARLRDLCRKSHKAKVAA